MTKKYEFVPGDEIQVCSRTLKRIRATVAIAARGIVPGDLGGYIESERNLSHDGEAWVFGEALVSGDAWVSGEARVYGKACVYGEAQVYGDAQVSGKAQVSGGARVSGEACVYGEAQVYGEACVSGEARVYGEARVSGVAQATKTPISISGLRWTVTITDSHMQIGCQLHSLNDWATFDNARIAQMDGRDARRFWDAYGSILLETAAESGRSFEPVEHDVKAGADE